MKFIMAMHGESDQNGKLSEFGREQVENLISLIRKEIEGKWRIIAASRDPKSAKTAKEIAEQVGKFPFKNIKSFDSGSYSRIKKLIDYYHEDVDAIIFVTYLGAFRRIPHLLLNGHKCVCPNNRCFCYPGSVLSIDFFEKTFKYIDPPEEF